LSIDEFGVSFIVSCGKMWTAGGLLRLLLLHQLDYFGFDGHCVRRRCETNRLFTALKGVGIRFYDGICRVFELKTGVRSGKSEKLSKNAIFLGLQRPFQIY
jgi:hypothetical protein